MISYLTTSMMEPQPLEANTQCLLSFICDPAASNFLRRRLFSFHGPGLVRGLCALRFCGHSRRPRYAGRDYFSPSTQLRSRSRLHGPHFPLRPTPPLSQITRRFPSIATTTSLSLLSPRCFNQIVPPVRVLFLPPLLFQVHLSYILFAVSEGVHETLTFVTVVFFCPSQGFSTAQLKNGLFHDLFFFLDGPLFPNYDDASFASLPFLSNLDACWSPCGPRHRSPPPALGV